MPTLRRRNDGCFFVRHLYRDHNTWQILGDGVRYLEHRGIKEGDWFPTDMFMVLWMRRLVYHGNAPPNPPVAMLPDTVEEAAVRVRVEEFHQLLYSAQVDSAWAVVWQGGPGTPTFEQFRKEIGGDRGRRLASWKIKDLAVYLVPVDRRSVFGGAKRIADVRVQIRLADSAPGQCDSREVTEYWFELNNQWRVLWIDF